MKECSDVARMYSLSILWKYAQPYTTVILEMLSNRGRKCG